MGLNGSTAAGFGLSHPQLPLAMTCANLRIEDEALPGVAQLVIVADRRRAADGKGVVYGEGSALQVDICLSVEATGAHIARHSRRVGHRRDRLWVGRGFMRQRTTRGVRERDVADVDSQRAGIEAHLREHRRDGRARRRPSRRVGRVVVPRSRKLRGQAQVVLR